MEAYYRVNTPREQEPLDENEVHVGGPKRAAAYINYILVLLQEKGHESVIVKARGKLIDKAVLIAETVKRRVAGLHQITDLGSHEVIDVYEPREEGLDRVELKRRLNEISITLSTQPLDTEHVGYQPPLPEDALAPLAPGEEQSDLGEETGYYRDRRRGPRGRGSRRGRGRGRGGRGRGRGEEAAAADVGGEGPEGGEAGGGGDVEEGAEGIAGDVGAVGVEGVAGGGEGHVGRGRKKRGGGRRRGGRGRGRGGGHAEGGQEAGDGHGGGAGGGEGVEAAD